jgi:hypothetical protein
MEVAGFLCVFKLTCAPIFTPDPWFDPIKPLSEQPAYREELAAGVGDPDADQSETARPGGISLVCQCFCDVHIVQYG